MMNIPLDPVLRRVSVRRYKPDPVPADKLERLLKAAMSAPSAHDTRPWRFLVIDERPLLDRITQVHRYAQMLSQAPMAIMVLGDLKAQAEEGFWVQDCAAATENILIEAVSQGLGTCWVGLHPIAERAGALRELFSIPPGIEPFCLIAVGYPAEEKEPPSDRYDPKKIHRNRWPS